MAVMAIINLVAIVLLSPIVWKLMKDYQRQLKEGKSLNLKLTSILKLKTSIRTSNLEINVDGHKRRDIPPLLF